MGDCQVCGKSSHLISGQLGACVNCIKEKPEEALQITDNIHTRSRALFDLPPSPPNSQGGILCGVCANNCRLSIGEKGYCGLVENRDERLARLAGTTERGLLTWYYDGLPTNCVAWWFCPGCTGAGYPKYAYSQRAEFGYKNLAVFYGACSLDCLFCQNWHYRRLAQKLEPTMSAEELANKVDEKVSCICYFGGDPSPQMLHALRVSELALENAKREDRILRVCWETNGYMNAKLAEKAAELSLRSGGVVKFDLKTCDEHLNRALCGVSNKPTLANFRITGEKFCNQRPELPLLTASTLLVPGYVDVDEVRSLAKFIADVDARIPYTLLAFYPCYKMDDLPTTSKEQAYACHEAAAKHLENVRIGNIHLLS